MAKVTKWSRYLRVPTTARRIYGPEAVELTDQPIRTDRVFGRRYTTWREVAGTTTYVVRAGDTLPGLARLFYERAELWWVIADFNALDTFYPLDLTEQTVLRIPPPAFAGVTRSRI